MSVDNRTRYITNKATDVETPILHSQFGKVKSRVNTAYGWLPHNIADVKNIRVMFNSQDANHSAAIIANAVSYTSLATPKASVDAWSGSSVAYTVGEIVYDSVTDLLYECTTAHTSSAGTIDTTKFNALRNANFAAKIDLVATATKQVEMLYEVVGYGV